MAEAFRIAGSHIEKYNGSTFILMTIPEIFQLLSEKNTELLSSLPTLKYSKINATLEVQITNSNNEIQLSLVGKVLGKYINVDWVNGKIPDHVVDANLKIHNLIGEQEELAKALSQTGISDNGVVPVSSYLKLLQLPQQTLERFRISHNVDGFALTIEPETDISELGSLAKTLYPYQRLGYSWLKRMLADVGGGLLGDEMGLGKTLQIIAVMRSLVKSGSKSILVVAPVSLLENWRRECHKFAPELKVGIHQGASRSGNFRSFFDFDVTVVAYSTLVNDYAMFNMIEWDLVVLDEAQNIKNPNSQIGRASCRERV